MAAFSPVQQSIQMQREAALRVAADIRRSDMTQMRNTRNPAQGAMDVVQVVLSILDHKPCTSEWNENKIIISDIRFVEKLKDFEPSTLTLEERTLISSLDFTDRPKLSIVAKLIRWLDCIYRASLKVVNYKTLTKNAYNHDHQEACIEVDLKKPLGMKLSRSGAVHTVVEGGQFESLGIKRNYQVI